MKLRRPPIIEAWIEFHLEAPDNEQTWPDEKDAFLQEVEPEFALQEAVLKDQVQLVGRDPSTLRPKEIKGRTELLRVRAFDPERTRCVQAGEGLFVYNLPKRGADYPGFDVLLTQALDYFETYSKCFRPQYVRTAALDYVDLVIIPDEGARRLNLDDYFNLGVRVPSDEGWPLRRIRMEVSIPLTPNGPGSDVLTVQFASEPRARESDDFRFRLHWHAICQDLRTLEREVLEKRLRDLHEAASGLFKDAMTSKLWAMFEPQEET